MKLNMRTFAVSMFSSGLIALGATVAIAQSVNNVDNTSPGESGHGAGCSNFMGACNAPREGTASGAYQGAYQSLPSSNTSTNTDNSMTTNPTLNPDNTTSGESGHGTGAGVNNCLPASEATPGHCISGGTNK